MKTLESPKKSLRIGYDQEADVLYLSLGEPRKGMEYQEVGNGIILRIDRVTEKVVGLTVMDFVQNFSSVTQVAQVPVAGEFVPVLKTAAVSV
ncbi:MAG: DUF2283 domain-containing protein [Chloroflexota bacterium]|nr:DUF2283 domain-containing protein [Chloroflexota bacterium]